jgi:predicted dehydrogenase
MNTTRRDFLKTSALTAAALATPSFLSAASASRVIGANDEIRVAVVGFNGRGGDHIGGVRSLRKKGEKVRIVALCDVDSEVLAKGVASFEKEGNPVTGYRDLRKLLENQEIDAISIASPNHWHALGAIWAVQAGKDVYLEKPVSHNVFEGRKIVEAARKYGRIVQTGTQSRSSFAIKEAVAWVRAGNLGKIKVARGLCYKPRNSIGKVTAPTAIPAHIDYDLWCGPAPKVPLMRTRLHYDWHWVWDTGCGDLGNQGIHQMDIARWFLGETALSPRVFSVGGRLGYVDDGETPNTQFVYHDYAAAPLIFEVRGLPEKKGAPQMDKYRGGSVAVIIECENGHVLVPNYSSAIAVDLAGNELKQWSGAKDHYENFYGAVRTRKVTDLTADILEGHLSSALCHTGNVSLRLGQKLAPEAIKDRLKSDPAANATFERMAAHLEANAVDLTATPLTFGEYLEMNPKKEKFTNHRKANDLLTREYRKPFVVPNKV